MRHIALLVLACLMIPSWSVAQTPLDELNAIIIEMGTLATTQTNKGRMIALQHRADVMLKIQQSADTWNASLAAELAAIKAELAILKALVTPTGMPPMPPVPPVVPPPVVVPPVVIPPVVKSDIIDPSRRIDWSSAGVSGGIPSRTTVCATLSPGATSGQINNAIASCPSGQVVRLSAGTYTLASGITFGGVNNVTLRGDGPDRTFLVFTGYDSCYGLFSDICISSTNATFYGNTDNNTAAASWTAGYAKGTTSITLSSTTGLSVGMMVLLDQLDDPPVDSRAIWVCQTPTVCTVEGTAAGRTNRAQVQLVRVTGIAGTTVTITPGLHMPNWRASQLPQVNWVRPAYGIGVEDLSMDHLTASPMSGVGFHNVFDCWLKNVRSLTPRRNHVWLSQAAHVTVRESYFYGTQNAESQSYGIETRIASDNLIENNIFHHITSPMMIGNSNGTVYGYNYSTANDYYVASWMQPSHTIHDAGVDHVLIEGNDGAGIQADEFHGTSHFVTVFRNAFTGWETGKSNNTIPVQIQAFHRFYNIIGNALGTVAYHTQYQSLPPFGSAGARSIFVIGWAGQQGTDASIPNDSIAATTMMRWGNYDVVSGTATFQANEVPSGIAPFGNAVPSSTILPASLYLTGKPSWFGAVPWPAIGPGAPGVYSNTIPARSCFESTPQVGGVLAFNGANCYPPRPAPPVSPPAGLPTRLHTIADLKIEGVYPNPPSTVTTGENSNYWSQEFAGRGLAYHPARKSLFATCHVSGGLVSEISIPAKFGETATFLQPCSDPVDGRKNLIMLNGSTPSANPIVVGGLLQWKDKLLVTEYNNYDANHEARKSHFVSSTDLSLPTDVQGPYTLVAPQAGHVAGFMAHVPLAWQAAIGAPALTGLGGISVISRSNFGPGFYAFDPDDLGKVDPVPTIPLVVYPVQLCGANPPDPPKKGCLHQFIRPDGSNPYFNWVSRINGIVWPENSRSIFLFGSHGLGNGCYGPSTTDPALVGTIYGSNPAPRCFDLVGFDGASFEQHSFHAYPYVNYVWVFDALDLLAVRAGTKQPEDVIPVEVGILRQLCGATTPCTDAQAAEFPNYMIRGATSDPATGKIYLERPGSVVEFTLKP